MRVTRNIFNEKLNKTEQFFEDVFIKIGPCVPE
jgi:hypothetical protein